MNKSILIAIVLASSSLSLRCAKEQASRRHRNLAAEELAKKRTEAAQQQRAEFEKKWQKVQFHIRLTL